MAEKNPRELVVEELEKAIGNWTVLVAYLEHQVDLQGHIIREIAKIVDAEKITPELQALLDLNSRVLASSSVDFANLESPLEAYKFPNVIANKAIIRKVQEKYLSKVL